VAGEKKRIVYQKFSSILSEECVVKEWYVLPDSDNPGFFLMRWFSLINNWDKMIRKFNPDKILICGGALISLWIIVFLIRVYRLRIEIIVFRYDIEHFRPFPKQLKDKFGHFVALKLEKYCFLRADKIIHKGLENELQYLPFYEKIKDKPHHLFRNFLDKKLIQKYNPKKKLSREDKEAHLVYGGGWYYDDSSTSNSFFKLYESFLKNRVHLHLYTRANNNEREKLGAFEKKYRYFHYEGHLDRKNLIKEYSKYDFGLNFYGFFDDKKNNAFVKTAFSNKNFDYLASMLPILTNGEAEAKSDFVVENRIGYSFKLLDYNKRSIYKQILDKKKYAQLVKNIGKYINKNLNNREFLRFITY